MDPRDFFRGLFGFPDHRGFRGFNDSPRMPRDDDRHEDRSFDEDFWRDRRGAHRRDEDGWNGGWQGWGHDSRGWSEDNNSDRNDDYFNGRGPDHFFNFRVFTDPLEIHKFFDQQMDDMMKSFSRGFGFGSQDGFHPFHPPMHGGRPPLDSFPRSEEDEMSRHSRDFMLKHDDYNPTARDHQDGDLDDKDVSVDDLTTLLKKKNNEGDDRPSKGTPHGGSELVPRDFFGSMTPWFGGSSGGGGGYGGIISSGFSQSQRVVQRPDGSTETEQRTRNSDGSETVVLKRRIGNQEHETRTTVEKDGSKTQAESFINMSESDLSDFNQRWEGRPGREEGPRSGREALLAPEPVRPPVAPPTDRLYSSIFSKFFGDK